MARSKRANAMSQQDAPPRPGAVHTPQPPYVGSVRPRYRTIEWKRTQRTFLSVHFCPAIRLKIRLNIALGIKKNPETIAISRFLYGGQYRTRTCDPMHVKHVLIPAELTVHQRGYYTRSRCVCQALFFRYHAISRSAASP